MVHLVTAKKTEGETQEGSNIAACELVVSLPTQLEIQKERESHVNTKFILLEVLLLVAAPC